MANIITYMSICFLLRAKKGRFQTFPWGTFQNIRRILHNFVLKIEVLWEKCVEKHKKRWRRISLHLFCKLQCFWEKCVAYVPHENVRKWHAKKKQMDIYNTRPNAS